MQVIIRASCFTTLYQIYIMAKNAEWLGFLTQRPNRLSSVLVTLSGIFEAPNKQAVEFERRENILMHLGKLYTHLCLSLVY